MCGLTNVFAIGSKSRSTQTKVLNFDNLLKDRFSDVLRDRQFYILLKKLTAVSLSPHDTPPIFIEIMILYRAVITFLRG